MRNHILEGPASWRYEASQKRAVVAGNSCGVMCLCVRAYLPHCFTERHYAETSGGSRRREDQDSHGNITSLNI